MDTREEELAKGIQDLLHKLGENPAREGLQKTPERFLKAMGFLTSGYHGNLDSIVNGALFESTHSEMIIVKDIELYSLCEHHLLPFFGKCHIGYIPQKHILGLSKLARIVELFARRFQVQERLTHQIAEALQEAVGPIGVGVVIEASHLCMMMRGVQKQNAFAQTSCLLGSFQGPATRAEFFNLIR